MANKAALKLPDQLIVRYFRQGELDGVTSVRVLKDKRIRVTVHTKAARDRVDHWRDLEGGFGYVPDSD